MEEDEIDPNMPAEDVLLQYMDSDDPDILSICVQCVSDALETCDNDFLDQTVIPSLITLMNSKVEGIIGIMIAELRTYGEYLFRFFPDRANSILMNTVLPLVHEHIESNDGEITEELSYAFAALVTLVDQCDFLDTELPYLVSMSKNTKKEVRLLCVKVISFLVQFFKPELWFNQLNEILSALSSDQLGSIRMSVPQLIALYAKRITNPRDRAQITGRYVLFGLDSTSNVRKAAAENLLSLSDALDQNERLVIILPQLNELLNDSIDAVRNSVYKNLGQLIASLGSVVDSTIISKYCSLLSSREATTSYMAAYSFPAVALAIGKDRWEELSSAFAIASSSRFPKVRRTLAFGLAAFGHILDQEELCNVAVGFLNDFPIVAIGVVSVLHEIVRAVESKESLLFCLIDPVRKYRDWRMRLKVSEQLRYCSEFFDNQVLFNSARDLVCDDVATVRKDAAVSCVHLLTRERLPFVASLAENESHVHRATAAGIIAMLDAGIAADAVPSLLPLCKDRVANVRIAAAAAARALVAKLEGEEADRLKAVLVELGNDEDVDVRKAATATA